MKRILTALAVAGVVIIAAHPSARAAGPSVNYDGGGGSSLPQCGGNPTYWGWYVQAENRWWYCPVGGDHWILT